ncbi:MAG: HAMP domain-containing sensor histidine kinase [Eubacteriales bacterium]|nr:HAMP domain-containing sensor histidine kinase [Eubacteriales bacterium]
MIRTLQKKFIITAMTAVTILLLVIVIAISGIFTYRTYTDVRWTAERMGHEGEGKPPRDEDIPQEGDNRRGLMGKREFTRDNELSVRFFLVRFDSDGGITQTDTGRISSVDDEEANEIAEKIYASGRSQGLWDGMYYSVQRESEGTHVMCIDISSQINSVVSVIVISLVIAGVSWICMLLLVIALSRRAIVPIAENIEKQKQFVTNAGHEIKTPLAIILANTEALELYNGESKWTRNIRTQTERLSGLMNNLLTLSKMDEAAADLPMEAIDLAALVQEMVLQFREPASGKGIAIEISAAAAKARANKDSLRQLIGILLDNAVKYTPQGGTIRVQTLQKGTAAVLRQYNTIDPASKEKDPGRLFDRFYRSDKARTQKGGGYGIGLSAARAIAEANKAQIRAYYEGEDSIVFEVMLMI